MKRIASPGGTWRLSDGTLADAVLVGAHVQAAATLHSVGAYYLDAIHPQRAKLRASNVKTGWDDDR